MDALDALTRRVRDVEGAVALVLFGSYARGDFGRKSDVDLLVLACPQQEHPLAGIRGAVVRAAIETEGTFRLPMHLAVLVANVDAPEEIGGDLLHAMWSDGVVLFAEAAALAAMQPAGLAPWVVVRFSAAGMPPHKGVRLSRRLHGRGGRPGVVAAPAVQLARGAMLLPASQAGAVRDVLDETGTSYDMVPVWRPV